jgi:hypothetical protein
VTFSFWEPERDNLPFVANEAGVALRVPDVRGGARGAGSERR